MTIKALYPTVRPTLNLDFAKTKALDPRVTFTRASTATFVGADGLIKTAGNNVPRFDHNPTTGESLGLLVEEARTNVLKYSNDFSQAGSWQFVQVTPIYNASIAPGGTQTATRLTTATTTSSQYITSTGANTVEPGVQTVSAYVKPGTCTQIQLQFNSGINTRICFDLTTNSTFNIQADGSNGVGTITNAGNGWKRLTLTSTVAATDTVAIYLLQNQGFQLSAGLTLEIWGLQAEAGSFPTSYIPTVASTVTRAADLASMTGTNFSSWYRQDQGTIYQSVKLLAASPQDNQYYGATFAAVTDATTRVTHDYSSGGGVSGQTIILSDAGATSATLVISPFNATTRKTASAMQVGSVAFAANGQIVTGTATAMPSTVDRMFLSKSGFTPNTTISRFAYYPVRLPNAQLQALTAA